MNIPYGPLLVVEDVPNILELLTVTLRFKGYPVITARNGAEALEMIEKERPALIITDILMPIMDGYTATEEIRKLSQYKDLPIIAMTADAMVGESAGARGLDEFRPDLVRS